MLCFLLPEREIEIPLFEYRFGRLQILLRQISTDRNIEVCYSLRKLDLGMVLLPLNLKGLLVLMLLGPGQDILRRAIRFHNYPWFLLKEQGTQRDKPQKNYIDHKAV